jgi:hypothetical protein
MPIQADADFAGLLKLPQAMRSAHRITLFAESGTIHGDLLACLFGLGKAKVVRFRSLTTSLIFQ